MANSGGSRARRALGEGLGAGSFWAVCDWLAAGPARTPWQLALLTLAAGLAGGLAAGLAGALLRRRGAALGLVVAGTLFLHAASLASKELGPGTAPGLRTTAWLAAPLLALAAGALAAVAHARSRPRLPGTGGAALVLASVPGASLAGWALSGPADAGSTAWLAACALPVVAAALALALGRAPRLLAGLALAAAAVLPVPVLVGEREPPRNRPEPSDARPPAGAPSVLLVVIDTLRADHVAGDPRETGAHAIARLADQGVRFDQAVSAASWTLPSVASILTSLYPSQHGAVTATSALAGDVATLAQHFQSAGWETVAFTGGAFVSPAFGLDRGFEYFDHDAEFRFRPLRVHVPLAWRFAKNRYWPQRWLLRRIHEFGGMAELRTRVERWLDARDPERPFLLLVHSYHVHDYYIYHPPSDDPVRAAGEALSERFAGRLTVHPSELVTASSADLDWFHRLYAHRIAHVDRELGRLLEAVEARVEPDALVTALVSDHGEGWDAERGRVHHGVRLHDDLLRVPFVLRAPGRVPDGLEVGAQVRTVDLMPTVMDLAGLAPPADVAGRSLLPSLRGDAPWPEHAFGEELSDARESLAVRTSAWKLIGGTDGEEAYRLDRDPEERAPVEAALPAALRAAWEGFRARYPRRELEATQLPEATLDHLRALGYVE